jgi:hypothetical protein
MNHKIHWPLNETFIFLKISIVSRFHRQLCYLYSQLALCLSLNLSATIAINSEFVGFAFDMDTV